MPQETDLFRELAVNVIGNLIGNAITDEDKLKMIGAVLYQLNSVDERLSRIEDKLDKLINVDGQGV
jgi:hypothetical protein